MSVRTGPTNSLVDVAGVTVGHATHAGDGWLTGATVVLAPPEGAVAGVDVRGGGPGTRETDLLDPRNAVERVHAVVLTGGSAFGLAVADGVMAHLERTGVGYEVGPGGPRVPIVPAAVVFDLGRGGDVAHRPGPASGVAACEAASAERVAEGAVGAGTGTVAGGLKGGVGWASQVLDDGATVAALVVVNAVGSVFDPATGELWGARHLVAGELDLGTPDLPAVQHFQAGLMAERAARAAAVGGATTLVVVATDRTLTKAQCAKVAGVSHDGLARAISPVHTMFDGDTAFALATGERPAPDPFELHALLTAAADCATRAVVRAVAAAEHTTTAAGTWPAYRDLLR
ncbi:MAG: P1 family peptidase [Angustibacter sp.]